ncbi:MAG: hypothetical protein ACUVRM_03430 [Bacillota bacterium]
MSDLPPVGQKTKLVRENPLNYGYERFIRFLLRGATAGLAAGIVAVGFRVALTKGEATRNMLLAWAHRVRGPGWFVLPLGG